MPHLHAQSGQEGVTHPSGAEAASPKTFFVDWAELEATACRAAWSEDESRNIAARQPRVITTVDAEISALRRNVREAAKAILSWVAGVVEHDHQTNLDQIVNSCLRPGPDVCSLNYTALAKEIEKTLHVKLSAKRVKTAIAHIRRLHEKRARSAQSPTVKSKLDALGTKLQDNFRALVEGEPMQRQAVRRSLGVDIMAAVRCSAGRLIENDYGEGIPVAVDIDQLEGQFLDFVRDLERDRSNERRPSMLAGDLHRFLVALCDYDQSSEADMRVVVQGSRVVADLMGRDSLPGLLAQLNVLVSGRHLLDTATYCRELLRIADTAGALHNDPQTRSFMNWVRRLPEERRVPSPLRVRSYCLNNVATHILERLFMDELSEPERWLQKAKRCLERMRERDSGFRLIRTTHVLYLTVVSKLSGDARQIEAWFTDLGSAKSIQLLQDLNQFDNCTEMIEAVEKHAIRALPSLRNQILRLA